MAKKNAPEEEVKFDENRPTLPKNTPPADAEVLSHNWQENSPAIDLRYPGTENTAVNVVDQQNAAEEKAEKKKEEKISKEEYERRTKLDVSDPEYINPSLDHHKVK